MITNGLIKPVLTAMALLGEYGEGKRKPFLVKPFDLCNY